MRYRPRAARTILLTGLALLVSAVFLSPFVWMFLGSFKTPAVFLSYPPVWRFHPTLENYLNVFSKSDFGKYIVNSTIVGTVATALGISAGVPAAYAIARYRQTGLGVLLLAARMAPGISFAIPLFALFQMLHLGGSYVALIASHLIITLPLIGWMMVGFIEAIPIEIEQAALVDGCTIWRLLYQIILPLTRQGIAASAILGFIFSWNNFLFALVLSSTNTKTVPVAVSSYVGYNYIDWGQLTAAASVITMPVLVLALFVQRHIVKGLVAGGISGW